MQIEGGQNMVSTGSLLGPLNVYIRQCNVRGLGEIYSTCSFLLLLLEHKLVRAIVEKVHLLSALVPV